MTRPTQTEYERLHRQAAADLESPDEMTRRLRPDLEELQLLDSGSRELLAALMRD